MCRHRIQVSVNRFWVYVCRFLIFFSYSWPHDQSKNDSSRQRETKKKKKNAKYSCLRWNQTFVTNCTGNKVWKIKIKTFRVLRVFKCMTLWVFFLYHIHFTKFNRMCAVLRVCYKPALGIVPNKSGWNERTARGQQQKCAIDNDILKAEHQSPKNVTKLRNLSEASQWRKSMARSKINAENFEHFFFHACRCRFKILSNHLVAINYDRTIIQWLMHLHVKY